ncbi:MAG: CoA transferase [Dehalococcoidales bacterium]|nr:MAG: CoA transferase [Dehalococcoidales bacterium]
MAEEDNVSGMLSPYRILDLTDEKGFLCGKMLGDLGADIIKIEKPDGDSSRNIGPYYHDEIDPEKSLYWFSYNANKRGITLDIENPQGKDIFKELVKTADVVVESFPPGYMNELGLGYEELEKINKEIILTSITPYGQTGPYRDFKYSDITLYAMGGYMSSVGDADRPPVRISHHFQTYLHGGGQAAQGVLFSLYHREMTGEGQYIDVSIHDSTSRITPERVTAFWDFSKRIQHRGGGRAILGRIWECKDGYVYAMYWGGTAGKRWNGPIVKWMESEGVATDFIKEFNWEELNLMHTSPEILRKIAEPTRELFMRHTKAELLEAALEHNAQVYPLNSTAEIAGNRQLAARDYWVKLDQPELGTTITYPGSFAKTTEAPPRVTRRAPLVGEHNEEIYIDELRYSEEKLQELKRDGII